MNTASPSTPPTTPSTGAPIRIYVLWHPDFTQGEAIAYQIYRWFRLEYMEGIPVFFRSTNARNSDTPRDLDAGCPLNYILPLVEAHMVADPSWRAYVMRLAFPDAKRKEALGEVRLFPVALDPLAFQMPPRLRSLNYIRHDISVPAPPSMDILLSQLTEVLCRDLRGNKPAQGPDHASPGVPGKIKLFLSHAKADGTDVPVRLKEYIQTHTQCETFFDETDIASGHEYDRILEDAIRDESAGMIAIQGDHYAERPWCRREIRRFQQPRPEPVPAGAADWARAFFVPPLVVVQNMSGRHIARTIPELGSAPFLRWTDGGERRIVSTLLREILLGLFYRRLARAARQKHSTDTVVVNRAPDPVMTQHLLKNEPSGVATRHILYPGYGLSQMEKDGLRESFPAILFRSLSENEQEDVRLRGLAGKVLRLGIGNSTDILSGGLSDDHNRELLIRLLRPLCRQKISILYGGTLPRPGNEPRVNFTEACLHLLLSERSATESADQQSARLYSVPPWPESDSVTPRTIAEWTDICSFHRVLPCAAGLPEPLALPPEYQPDPAEYTTAAERKALLEEDARERAAIRLQRDVTRALCLTHMRRLCCGSLRFPIADREDGQPKEAVIQAFAHLFIGGRLEKVSGIAPGLFEEILYALEASQPVFLIGAGYGATGAVCRWLTEPTLERPPELAPDHYLADPAVARVHQRVLAMKRRKGSTLKPTALPDVLDGLWKKVRTVRSGKGLATLLNNGLSDADNATLLSPQADYGEICRLVWEGLGRICTRP